MGKQCILQRGVDWVESVLKRTRERFGMTLEQAARHLSISPGYLLQIECGRRGVGAPRAMQIAELYGMNEDELFVPIRFKARFVRIKEGDYDTAADLAVDSGIHIADHLHHSGDQAQKTV